MGEGVRGKGEGEYTKDTVGELFRHELRTPASMKISLSSQQSSVNRQHYLQVS
ncbi:hypothetical protein FDUTEX481_06836 [Tolypothrix sp. PCC 7601]|nr:hypothetical protein FDUTEX481_06836 [Tolypothrix sp. PCC 7601]